MKAKILTIEGKEKGSIDLPKCFFGKIREDIVAKVLEVQKIKNHGDVKTDYVIVAGSIQGPAKRQLLITAPLRETKKQKKKNYVLEELR